MRASITAYQMKCVNASNLFQFLILTLTNPSLQTLHVTSSQISNRKIFWQNQLVSWEQLSCLWDKDLHHLPTANFTERLKSISN